MCAYTQTYMYTLARSYTHTHAFMHAQNRVPTGNPEWNSLSFPWFFPDEKMYRTAFTTSTPAGVWGGGAVSPLQICWKWDLSEWFWGIFRLSNLTFISLFQMWNFWEKTYNHRWFACNWRCLKFAIDHYFIDDLRAINNIFNKIYSW